MSLVKLNTPRALPILMVDATDGFTEEPGLAPAVTVRKAGGAFAAAAGAAPVDRGNGRYEYTPTAGELDTLGTFEYRVTAAGARNYNGIVQVVDELPGSLKAGAISSGTFLADAINAAVIANDAITAAKIANGAIDAATFAAGAINAAAIATGAIDADAIAADAVTEIQAGLATAAAVAGVQADTDALQVDTAAIIAAVAGVQADTDNIQGRIPAALVGGRMDASIGAVAANAITAAGLDATVGGEIADAVWDEPIAGHLAAGSTGEALNASGGGATPSDIADAVWDEARAGHVAAGSFGEGVLVAAGGLAAASIANDAITAAKVAPDVGTEIAAAVNTNLSAAHGAGSWEGGGGITPAQIADAVLEEIVTDHSGVAGSLAQVLLQIKGLVNGNVLHDSFIYDVEGKLTSCRIRVYPTAGDLAAGTNLLGTFTVLAVNGAFGPTNYRVTQS